MKILVLAFPLSVFFVAGCANSALMRKATIDLSCPEDDLDVDEVSDTTSEVRGCGKKATYIEACNVCTGTDCGCAWIMSESGVKPAP